MVATAIANAAVRVDPPENIVRAEREFAPLAGAEPVSLMLLRPRSCRWPVGMDGDGIATFCGCDREGEAPYCEPHRKASRQPLKPGSPKTGNELARSLRRYV